MAAEVAGLGYPGLRGDDRKNPALVLLAVIAARDVEVLVIEALPWLVIEHRISKWEWLIRETKFNCEISKTGLAS